MIAPDNKYKQAWNVFIFFLTVLAAVEIPLRLVLGYTVSGAWRLLDFAITASFCLDLVLNFLSADTIGGKLVQNPRRIARHYLSGWFIVDFLAAFPFELIFTGPMAALTGGARVLRLFRLFRLTRLARFMQRMAREDIISLPVLRMLFLTFWVLLIAHWTACGWIALGGVPDVTDSLSVYIEALYWSITTITTIGYGDITPDGNAQMVFTMFIQLIGAATYGYVIGNIASLMANIDVSRAQYLEKMEKVSTFMRFRKIPAALQEQIRNYYTYLWESRRGYDESQVLADLPAPLETRVAMYLNRGVIEKVPIFEDANEDLISRICLRLRAEVFTPGDYIFRKGEIGSRMYFISRGSVDVVSENGREIHATLREGNFFGEIALLMSQPRTASIRAMDYCDVYSLDKEQFESIMRDFPDVLQRIRQRALERQAQVEERAEEHEVERLRQVPPVQVENLYVQSGKGGPLLSWSPVNDAAVYQVMRLDQGMHRWRNINACVQNNHYLDIPASGQPAYYRVRAVNQAGTGAWSEVVAV